MAKKIILAIIIIIFLSIFVMTYTSKDYIDVYIDGENVTVATHTLSNINSQNLNKEICDYTINAMNDSSSNITTLKNGIHHICLSYGLKNPEINIDSSIGKNQIPVMVHVSGTSMLPTLQDGEILFINKTKNIHVGDIVVANSEEYGGIIKRVGEIKGDEVYLESDNKNISYEYINGKLYEIKGVTTWTNIANINGVVMNY
ncbi:S24/S26 family peptidase [uncultured Methanobrevibacter sp.]|uniref:S24/S26 family peptidase n=1 Tax=uncultured Methanobrevibacter sp. TaxID=253161 RepID=UPI0025F702D7|nr:S24/S26 family peptidase [uncultured Methanobrevibacter sp.]